MGHYFIITAIVFRNIFQVLTFLLLINPLSKSPYTVNSMSRVYMEVMSFKSKCSVGLQ